MNTPRHLDPDTQAVRRLLAALDQQEQPTRGDVVWARRREVTEARAALNERFRTRLEILNDAEAHERAAAEWGLGEDLVGTRVLNAMLREGLTPEQTAAMSDRELRELRNVGPSGIDRIREAAARHLTEPGEF